MCLKTLQAKDRTVPKDRYVFEIVVEMKIRIDFNQFLFCSIRSNRRKIKIPFK